ncbi:alpha/beta fold hydrolase [Lysobacter korlensis]|uniref:Alpha/beta fold hydrolase n=1 Tax=Lysobacter korlensis TaxID=553636 RepID=A0ABV6RXV8_9GAMM
MDAEPRTVEVCGLRIGYRRAGRGKPLLLLHGGFSDSREWRPQLDGLADELDVIAMDCLGCGVSADAPPGFALAEYADIAAGFLRALGLESAHVGGISFGSLYALVLYRHHPEAVRSLVLAGAYAGWAGSLAAEEVARRIAWAEGALTRPADEWGPDFLATVYSDPSPELFAEAMEILRDVRPGGFTPVARTFWQADVRDVLPTIQVRTLLINGEQDARATLPVTRQLQSRIPDATLAVVPGAGHGVNGEAPLAFNTAVQVFLSRVPG